MPSELYRTYQVLIEETVDPLHPKREKTGKNDRHNSAIHHALRVTNELFQDAVCYYTIMLAGLAGNEQDGDRPLNPLWHEITDEEGKYKKTTDTVVQRMAGKYAPLAGCKTAESVIERCFEKPSDPSLVSNWTQLRPRLYRELEEDGTERENGTAINCKDMATFASNHTRDLCNPAGNQTPAIQAQRNENYFAQLAARLRGPEDDEAIGTSIELKWCFMTPDGGEVRGKDALVDYVAAFLGLSSSRKLKTPGNIPDSLKSAGQRLIEEWGDEPNKLPTETRASFAFRKAAWEKKAEGFPLSSYATSNKPNQRLWYCLRYKWCRDHVSRVSLLEQIKDCEVRTLADDATNVVTEWKRLVIPKRIFPFFTSLFSQETNTVWLDFDDAAFATAAEDVFKFGIRTRKRAAEITKLRSVESAANNGIEFIAFAQESSPTGKSIVVRGMRADDRRTKMVQLLKKLAEERELDREYGIDNGTIGGWVAVRARFLRLEQWAATNAARRSRLPSLLVSAVDKCQQENTQGFGSPDFFHALCDPDYHFIWSRAGEQTDAAVANGIKDFVAYYARYSEWIEDLNDLTEEGRIKPISYTFPGTPNRFGKTSQRHFNFKARLGTRLVFPKLFTETNRVYSLVKNEEARTVMLSARRLKRDRILDAKGESAFALWCPPLVIEKGDARPNAGKRDGESSKMKDVSFSLMVEPREADAKCEPPVHLNVQLPIESKQAGKLCQGQIFFAEGSLRGYAQKGEADSDKRRSWKWPCDLSTSEKIKPRDLWCGDGTRDGFSVKTWILSSAGGWKGEPKTVPDFHVLSVDLGNRFCAAFARLRVHRDANDPKHGRMLSPDHGWALPIFAQIANRGTLRLQGEDAMVWDHKRGPGGECMKDSTGKYLYELQPEPFGNDGRGRFPKPEELQRFRDLADTIVPLANLACHADGSMSYPELGDHLAFRLKRRLSRIRMLFKLRWLSHHEALDKHNKHQRKPAELIEKRSKAVEMLAGMASRAPRDEDEKLDGLYAELRTALAAEAEWSKLSSAPESSANAREKARRGEAQKSRDKAHFRKQCVSLATAATEPKWQAFIVRIEHELAAMLEGPSATNRLIEQVVDWCLPLRGRHWHWQSHRDTPTLVQGPKNECPDYVPLLMGMRGLSMRRLDQVLNLRQLCQSNAKIERRRLQPDRGVNDIVIPRGGELHDPCPDLLKTSNDLREQRVYQTAHLILTEALGLELKNPAEVERDGKMKKDLKSEMDLHGAYQPKTGKDGKSIPRCSVIVLEDLSRYRTSQERTRAENSRLMQWAHRKIVDKLSDLAKPFGLTIMLVDPAFSSRFDSRTGVAGIRVNEVRAGFDQEMPYAAWKRRLNKSGKKADLAERVNALAETFKAHSGYKGTLFLAVEGGKEFFSARSDESEGHQNADENAAINIGLRALAHPDRLDIFPRLKTRRKNEETVIVNQRRGWFTAPTTTDADRELKKIGSESSSAADTALPATVGEDDPEESSEYPNYFAVLARESFSGLPADQAHAPTSATKGQLPDFNAYARPLFLKKVQEAAYARVTHINAARLAKWRAGKDAAKPDEIKMD